MFNRVRDFFLRIFAHDQEPGYIDERVEFPIRVIFDDDSEEFYEDEIDLCMNLEWFDSETWTDCAAYDAQDRELDLELVALNIKLLKLKQN